MFYSFCDNVYLVKGYVNYCVYDFNSKKLYSINSMLGDKLNQMNEFGLELTEIDNEFRPIINYLLNNKLIKEVEIHTRHDIEKIKSAINNISRFAWIEITKQCNLRCRHCYNESDINQTASMSVKDFCMVVDKLIKIGVNRIQIIGGEPFFDQSALKEMLDYAVGKFEFIEIFTNGTLLSERWIDYLKDKSICVALSVYSYDEDMHDSVTGVPGSLKKTNDTIERLNMAGIKYRVCNIRMKGIEIGDQNTDLYVLGKKRDIVRMSGRADISLFTKELLKEKLITKKSFEKPLDINFSAKVMNGHNCFYEKMYISSDLQIFPCVMERRISHGTVKEDEDICLSDKIRLLKKEQIEECNVCEYRYTCFDCRPDTLTENIYKKPWYCTYNPYEGKWIDIDKFIEQFEEYESN